MKLSWLKLFKSETQDLQKAPLETGGINFSGRHLNDYANQDIKYGAEVQTHSLGIQPEKSIDVYGHQVNSPAGNKELFHHIISKDTTTHHKLSLSPDPEDRGVAGLMVEHYKDFPDWKGVPTVKLSHTDEPGFGFGSYLYKEALKHHGKLQSDSMTSPSANKTWDKIISSPDVTGEKGIIGARESRHMAEYTPKKLAASELEKGLKGDWQKEGYKITHEADSDGYHNLTAFDKNGNKIGESTFRPDYEDPEYLKVLNVDVHPDHRRKGVASAMYSMAEQKAGKFIYPTARDASVRSPDGQALWGQSDRSFGPRGVEYKRQKGVSKSEDLKKAPVEYVTDPSETHKKIPALNETYPVINRVQLPNGLIYQQHAKNEIMGTVHVHHLYHPNEKNPVAEVITRPDPENEMNHKVSYSQVSPDHKGKGLGKQAYLAALVFGKGVGRLLSDNELSRNAHKMWTSLKGISGLGGKIGSYVTHKMYDKGVSPAKYAQAHQDQHQVFVKNKKALDHNAMFPAVDIGDGVKETKLAASEDLKKSRTFKTSVQSVSPSIGLERLKQIKQDNYVGAGGKDYDPEELHQRMFEIQEKQAAKQKLFPEQESEKTHGDIEQMAPPMPGKKMFGKSELEKAIAPKDFSKIKVSHNRGFTPTIDFKSHIKSHPAHEGYLNHIVNSPDVVKNRLDRSGGIATKMIHDVRPQESSQQMGFEDQETPKVEAATYMTKPYFAHAESSTKSYSKHPIKGWATLTTKDLLHAADMGHMAEDVQAHVHNGVPVTVHKFSEEHEPFIGPSQQIHPLDAQKIAVMDFLTGNNDRHGGNIMVSKNSYEDKDRGQQYNSPLLIDHERNFQYNRAQSNKFGKYNPSSRETPANFLHDNFALNQMTDSSDRSHPEEQGDDLHAWWKNAAPKVKEAFNKNIEHIKDPALRSHIENNFNQRMAHLQENLIDGNYYDMFRMKRAPSGYGRVTMVDGIRPIQMKRSKVQSA